MVRGKITFTTKPHSCQRCSEGSNNPCAHQGPETPQRQDRTVPECLLLRYGSAVDWVQQTWVWHKPQEEVAINPIKSCQNLHRTEEIDAGRAQTEPCAHQDPGERSTDPTRDWPRLARECPGDSSRGVGWQRAAAWSGALSVALPAWDLWKEVPIIFITSTMVWPQVNSKKGTQSHPSTENSIKDLLSMDLPIRRRPNFPLSQSLQSGNFHNPFILLHQSANRLETTIREN